MDEIQRILIKAGRKDLAQKYYLKVSQKKELSFDERDDTIEETEKIMKATTLQEKAVLYCTKAYKPKYRLNEAFYNFKIKPQNFKQLQKSLVKKNLLKSNGEFTIKGKEFAQELPDYESMDKLKEWVQEWFRELE